MAMKFSLARMYWTCTRHRRFVGWEMEKVSARTVSYSSEGIEAMVDSLLRGKVGCFCGELRTESGCKGEFQLCPMMRMMIHVSVG